ncbi:MULTISPECIES: YafY family protein [unclassified Alcanivorax]|jgi:predicted DNA-binding transcriptional regulator YafY|uniref:helix-turn-helix transcriptional regulator n=1 Tax=unclassified Alcanivorax TaxID=2638842 RepID=UPI0008A097A4|nr:MULTISPECIES: YafY family protein [unclassified Alcanivorax]MBB10037.1 DNA-binding transcriptional regulator [Alcanivorax sp.]MEE3388429.1 YafY family protein [Pseudomonadota bacterium]SEF80068.1 Predicted DNA-binding transcriptional regulator YafY, contains an HTH and WYL domains [Alcanivorax sp. DSM 26293]
MRRAERLFQIVQIIGASQWTTAQALAERLAVSERTIYRDIDHLSASGVPVYSQAGKGYALLEGYQLPPLMFSVEEWQALLTGLAMAQGWAGRRQAEALRAVQEKLAMAVPAQLRAMTPPVSAPPLPERRMLGALLDPLQQAIAERAKVRLHYRDLQEQHSKRVIWPLGLYFWGHCWTLAGWCELRGAFRHFRVDRIVILQTLEDSYPVRPGQTLADYEASFDCETTKEKSDERPLSLVRG